MTAAPARGLGGASRPSRVSSRVSAGAKVAAAELPIARVLVDVSLAHLDRPYDYLVAESDSASAQPGVRIRVRFAGRLVGGYVLQRTAVSEHPGRLGFVERVVSPEPVLHPEIADLARAVAERYAGSTADVLRLAVPPRHAKTEDEAGLGAREMASRTDAVTAAEPTGPAPGTIAPAAAIASAPAAAPPKLPVSPTVPVSPMVPSPAQLPASSSPADGWQRYPAGDPFLAAIRQRRAARAVWQALPGEDWPARLADAAATAASVDAGALLIVPDARDLVRLNEALTAALGPGRHVILAADLGPAERYRRFLAVSRGEATVVAGTRAAVFAPVADLGLVAIFDDGDDLLAEQRAPYPHAREVLMLRSAAQSCALLVGGFARTAEAQLLVESGWARPIVAQRAVLRASAPRIEAAGDDYSTGADSPAARARLTPAAFAAAREALKDEAPVLIQVPRRGYLPMLACARCRQRAQCRHCRGPLALAGSAPDSTPESSRALGAGGLLSCRWCGQPEAHYSCGACGSGQLRAVSIGAGRTAEELGRAFPGVPVINSSGSKVRATVPDAPALVIATPGAEPVATAGYGAALLLDGGAMLGRANLRAAEETLRRWMAAATLVRSAAAGGRVVIGADASLSTVQALIRWDPVGHAATELAARRELGFPPAAAMASIEGSDATVLAVLDRLDVPPDGEVLGPVALDDLEDSGSHAAGGAPDESDKDQLRALVRAPQAQRKALAAALRAVAAGRSARKEGGGLRIRVDPSELF